MIQKNLRDMYIDGVSCREWLCPIATLFKECYCFVIKLNNMICIDEVWWLCVRVYGVMAFKSDCESVDLIANENKCPKLLFHVQHFANNDLLWLWCEVWLECRSAIDISVFLICCPVIAKCKSYGSRFFKHWCFVFTIIEYVFYVLSQINWLV